jgi:hypothetical protein
MALFEGSKDIVWLRNMLCEFGICQGQIPTTRYHDNQGSIAWANESNLRKVKHIDLSYHFTNMLITAGQVYLGILTLKLALQWESTCSPAESALYTKF